MTNKVKQQLRNGTGYQWRTECASRYIFRYSIGNNNGRTISLRLTLGQCLFYTSAKNQLCSTAGISVMTVYIVRRQYFVFSAPPEKPRAIHRFLVFSSIVYDLYVIILLLYYDYIIYTLFYGFLAYEYKNDSINWTFF